MHGISGNKSNKPDMLTEEMLKFKKAAATSPNACASGDMKQIKSLLVKNFPDSWNREHLIQIFSAEGKREIENVRLEKEKATGNPYALVFFIQPDDCAAAKAELHNQTFEEKVLDIQDNVKLQRPQWEIVEKLYRKETKLLDRNLEKLHDFLKPHAKSIYYDRKVEYINMVHEKQKFDAAHLQKQAAQQRFNAAKSNSVVGKMNKKHKEEQGEEFQNNQKERELIEIMKKYDIKHPLRGIGFENTPTYKQQFKDKILGILGGTNAYLGYKKDQRGTMDTTFFDEKYLKEEQDRFHRERVEMTYRLYGKEGLQEHEHEKLKQWKVIRPSSNLKRVRIKKRVQKRRQNKDTKKWELYSTDMDGSNSSCYSVRYVHDYEDNEDGDDILKYNSGFQLKPLCPEIYGKAAAEKSKKRHDAKLFEANQEKIRRMIAKASPGRGKFNTSDIKLPNAVRARNLSMNQTPKSTNTQQKKMMMNTFQNSSSRNDTRNQFFSANMQESHVSIPSSTIDMSFLPSNKAIAPVASNKPHMRNAIVMPHLAKRQYIKNSKTSPRGPFQFNTIQQLDNSSEHSYDEHSHDPAGGMDNTTMSVGSGFAGRNPPGGFAGHNRTNTDLMAGAYQTAGSSFAPHASQQIDVSPGFPGHLRARNEDQNQTMLVLPSAAGRKMADRATHRIGFPGKSQNSSPFSPQSRVNINSNSNMGYMSTTNRKAQVNNKISVPMEALSQYSATIKGDLRKRGSPFRYGPKDKSNQAQESRRALGDGRANKVFAGATPKLRDPDIRGLISRYPVGEDHVRGDEDQEAAQDDRGSEGVRARPKFDETSTDPTYIAINSPTTDKAERKLLMQRAIGNLTRNIDKMEAQSKAYYKEMMTKMVVQNLRDAELLSLAEAFKEIDYADAEQLQNLFEYHSKDRVGEIRGQVDVAREYHEGKLDPQKLATKRERNKKR